MDKKGIVFLYRLMLGVALLVLAIGLAYPTKAPIDESRTNLTCSNPANDFDQATCWILDGIKFLFVGAMIFLSFYIMFKVG